MKSIIFYRLFRSFSICLLACSWMLCPANAQSKKAPEFTGFYLVYLAPDFTPEELQKIERDEYTEPEIFYLLPDGSKQAVIMTRNSISPMQAVANDKPLSLFIETGADSPPTEVGKVSIDPKSNFQFIVVKKDPKTSKFLMRSYPVSSKQSPAGTYTVINATEIQIAVSILEEKGLIPANESRVFPLKTAPMSFYKVEFYLSEGSKAKQFERFNSRYFEGRSYVSFVAKDDRRAQPVVFNLSEDFSKMQGYLEGVAAAQGSAAPTIGDRK